MTERGKKKKRITERLSDIWQASKAEDGEDGPKHSRGLRKGDAWFESWSK